MYGGHLFLLDRSEDEEILRYDMKRKCEEDWKASDWSWDKSKNFSDDNVSAEFWRCFFKSKLSGDKNEYIGDRKWI